MNNGFEILGSNHLYIGALPFPDTHFLHTQLFTVCVHIHMLLAETTQMGGNLNWVSRKDQPYPPATHASQFDFVSGRLKNSCEGNSTTRDGRNPNNKPT